MTAFRNVLSKTTALAMVNLGVFVLAYHAQRVPEGKDTGRGWCEYQGRVVPCPTGGTSGGGTTSGSSDGGAVGWLLCKTIGGFGCPRKTDTRKQDAYDLNQKGVEAFNNGELTAALSYFEQALKKSPNDPVIKQNIQNTRDALAAKAAKEKADREDEQARLKDKAAAENMQKSIQDFAKTLNAAPTSGGLDFDGGSSSATPNNGRKNDGLDFTTGVDTSVVDLRDADLYSSKYFYALQTRTLTPMADGGHPIDSDSKPLGVHGLVGGTTWTYGFKRPGMSCDDRCKTEIRGKLDSQLRLYCSSQSEPAKCISDGLPFTPADYDMVVSMASYHTALEDLATRVVFDNSAFGETTRQNKEIFSSLLDRNFDTLDCHSNGAMLCLAALRSGKTTAKVVRLFGPQITPEAAERWQALANDKNSPIKVEIYINNGDPVPSLSWKLPKLDEPTPETSKDAWMRNVGSMVLAAPSALINTLADSGANIMDKELKSYGFTVIRKTCSKRPNLACHSMNLYEGNAK